LGDVVAGRFGLGQIELGQVGGVVAVYLFLGVRLNNLWVEMGDILPERAFGEKSMDI
jgi:hypothetical protein